jgi:hypothetical protein
VKCTVTWQKDLFAEAAKALAHSVVPPVTLIPVLFQFFALTLRSLLPEYF